MLVVLSGSVLAPQVGFLQSGLLQRPHTRLDKSLLVDSAKSSLLIDTHITTFHFLSLELRNIMLKRLEQGNQVDLYSKISYYKAAHCLEYIEKTWRQIKQNVNYKLATGNLVINLYGELRKARTKNG